MVRIPCSLIEESIKYINDNKQVRGDVVNNNTILVRNMSILQPEGNLLPQTDKTKFYIFINGQFIPHEYIIDITETNEGVIFVVDTEKLGFEFEPIDDIEDYALIVGKFKNR